MNGVAAPAAPASKGEAARVRVGGNVEAAAAAVGTRPIIQFGKQSRIQGIVVIVSDYR